MEFNVEFYQKENENVPVLDFLLSLQPKLRAKAYSEIELLRKHGTTLTEPYVKPMKGDKNRGIYELRIKFSTDITRIFYFCFQQDTFVLLNGFVKKTNKTPERELVKARKYKADYERRCSDE